MMDIKFTDAFLDTAYLALLTAESKTEHDKAVLDCIIEVCNAEGISVRKYMRILTELNRKIEELGDSDD